MQLLLFKITMSVCFSLVLLSLMFSTLLISYMNIWSPILGIFSRCRKDVENEHDAHAVAIEKKTFVRTAQIRWPCAIVIQQSHICVPDTLKYVCTCRRKWPRRRCLRARNPSFISLLWEHAKLRALRAHVSMCFACLRAHVLTCQRVLRAQVPCVLCLSTFSRAITTTSEKKFSVTCFL